MKRFLICLAAVFVLSGMLAGGVCAASGAPTVGHCADIISSLSMPDYVPSTVRESELGRLAADAMRAGTGSDIAILTGGELSGGLGKGDVSEAEIRAVLPDNEAVTLITITVEELWQSLECAVSRAVLREDERLDVERSAFDGFPQISGFMLEYDVSQRPGSRIRSISLTDGTELAAGDSETRLTAAVSAPILTEAMGYESFLSAERRETGTGTAELLLKYVTESESISAEPIQRVKAVGTADNTLVSELRILPLLPYAIIMILLVSIPLNRHRLRNMDGSYSKRYRDYGDGNYEM